MASALRARIHDVLSVRPDDPLSRGVNRVILTLIVLNVAAVVFESIGDNAERYGRVLQAFETGSLVVFAIEYVLRLWSAGEDPRFRGAVGRLRWMATPFAVVDLLAILPGFLPLSDLRYLRVLRMLRLLKLGRYSESVRILTRVLHNKREELGMALFLVLVALVAASGLMYYAERDAQPETFSSIPATMWWGIVTLTTIGYGDAVPVTTAGKLVGSLAALAGIFALALPVGILASGFTEELQARRKAPHPCPHCGKELPPHP